MTFLAGFLIGSWAGFLCGWIVVRHDEEPARQTWTDWAGRVWAINVTEPSYTGSHHD